jgi:hypothetical protein
MSDLMCEPFRPGWQVGISERRKLCRPGGAFTIRECERWGHGTLEKLAATRGHGTLEKLAATWGHGTLENVPLRSEGAGIGEAGGDEEDVRLDVRAIPSRVASRNLRATEALPSRRGLYHSGVRPMWQRQVEKLAATRGHGTLEKLTATRRHGTLEKLAATAAQACLKAGSRGGGLQRR